MVSLPAMQIEMSVVFTFPPSYQELSLKISVISVWLFMYLAIFLSLFFSFFLPFNFNIFGGGLCPSKPGRTFSENHVPQEEGRG